MSEEANNNPDKKDNSQPGNRGPKVGRLSKVFAFVAMFGVGAYLINEVSKSKARGEAAPEEVSYTVFEDRVETGKIDKVIIQGDKVTGFDNEITPDVADYTAVIPAETDVYSRLDERGAEVEVKAPESSVNFGSILWIGLMLGLPVFIIWSMFSARKGTGGGPMAGLGKANAKMAEPEKSKVRFDDVAGVDEAKQEVAELVQFLKNAENYRRTKAKMPKGALLVGPPGTGKTLLAKAVAGEAGVPFLSMSGSDFDEVFVGVGASRVRSLFKQAKEKAPCVVFIDEIDAVGRRRGSGLNGGSSSNEQTLNQLLVEMDGFEDNSGIIVLAATNRSDVLDPALMRPGRFDRQVVVGKPEVNGREKILRVHAKDKPLAEDVDLRMVAQATPGFAGADLANLVNEAALLAGRAGKATIDMNDFHEAIDKVALGVARTSVVLNEKLKERIAYHEVGHTLISLLVPGNDPVRKVTIIPRGGALGVTWNVPDEDKFLMSEKELKAQMALLYGGRIAEEMIYGKENITTGASNDIQRATELARQMVTVYGFSDTLGRVRYADKDQGGYLGSAFGNSKPYSETTARLIDKEVKRLTSEAEQTAREVLTKNSAALEALTSALIKQETLTGAEINKILSLPNPDKKRPANDQGKPPGQSGPSYGGMGL